MSGKEKNTYSIMISKRANLIFEKTGLEFETCIKLLKEYSAKDPDCMISIAREK